MLVREFEAFIYGSREAFAVELRKQGSMDEMKDFLKRALNHCCSNFEEEALSENLHEVFQEYLEEVKAA